VGQHRFSNVTAADFKYSIERAADLKEASPTARAYLIVGIASSGKAEVAACVVDKTIGHPHQPADSSCGLTRTGGPVVDEQIEKDSATSAERHRAVRWSNSPSASRSAGERTTTSGCRSRVRFELGAVPFHPPRTTNRVGFVPGTELTPEAAAPLADPRDRYYITNPTKGRSTTRRCARFAMSIDRESINNTGARIADGFTLRCRATRKSLMTRSAKQLLQE
jgi:hypothetical protein